MSVTWGQGGGPAPDEWNAEFKRQQERDALREQVAGLGGAMWRIRDAVMHEGGWCYGYETAEGKRIADAVNAIWREARDAGLPVLGTDAVNPAPTPAREAGLTAALAPFLRYADELLWGDRGVRDEDVVLRWPYYGPPRVIVRRSDFKALRAACPAAPTGVDDDQQTGK